MATGEADLKAKARKASDDGDLELAVELYSEAIDAGPGTADLYADRARVHVMLGNCIEAIADANKSIELDPSQAEAYIRKGSENPLAAEELLDTVSLEEDITPTPQTVPHNTIEGSSGTAPFRCEKIMAGVDKSASAQARQKPDFSFLQEFLDYSPSDKDSIKANPQTAQHNTIDGLSSNFPLRHEKLLTGSVKSASSLTPQEPDAPSLEELPGTTSSKEMTTGNPQTVLPNTTHSSPPSALSIGSKILMRRLPHWYNMFYIRMDRWGSFCMYPDLGGPFQSLQEAEDAINHRHEELRRAARCNEQDKIPEGGLPSRMKNGDENRYLVQALLDQYNEDNNLFGNLAHELEVLVKQQWIYEDSKWYYHFNFITQTKEAGRAAALFFAEVSHMQGEDAWEVNCFCKIQHEDNGWCYGCVNNGSHDMRHPMNADAYTGGHLDVFLPFSCEEISSSDDEEGEEAAGLRNIFEDDTQFCLFESFYPPERASVVEC